MKLDTKLLRKVEYGIKKNESRGLASKGSHYTNQPNLLLHDKCTTNRSIANEIFQFIFDSRFC